MSNIVEGVGKVLATMFIWILVPIGGLIALFILFLIIAYWKSNLPTNPFADTAIAGTGTNSTQGFGSTSWLSLWGSDFNATNWFMAIAIPMMMLSVAFYALHDDDEDMPDSELVAPRGNLGTRLLSARPRFQRTQAGGAQPSLTIVQDLRTRTGPRGPINITPHDELPA